MYEEKIVYNAGFLQSILVPMKETKKLIHRSVLFKSEKCWHLRLSNNQVWESGGAGLKIIQMAVILCQMDISNQSAYKPV